MDNLKLGEKERYEIEESIIKKYNLREGTVSPFSRLIVIDKNKVDDEVDIRIPSDTDDIDIRISADIDRELDIKTINNDEVDDGIDIKPVSSRNDDDLDIKMKS